MITIKIVVLILLLLSMMTASCQSNAGFEASEDVSDTESRIHVIDIPSSSPTDNDEYEYEIEIEKIIEISSLKQEKSEKPTVIEYKTVTDGRVVIAGRCEAESEILVVADGKVKQRVLPNNDTFIVEYLLSKANSPLKIELYAFNKDKRVSESENIIIRFKPNEECKLQDYVRIGKESQLFFTNTDKQYTNNEALPQKYVEKLKEKTENRIKELKENGINIIYVLVPNPNELYSDNVIGITKGKICLREEYSKIYRQAGAKVIDMADVLTKHLSEEFDLYHMTDSHWTEYGAYFAYKALCEEIGLRFNTVKPRDISEFGFRNEKRKAGDLYADLGFDETRIEVTSVFSNIEFETPLKMNKYAGSDRTRINDACMEEMTLINEKGKDGPNILMMRDSYSIMLCDWLSEQMGKSYYKKLWDFNYNIEELKEKNIDYLIYLISDMNLEELGKN